MEDETRDDVVVEEVSQEVGEETPDSEETKKGVAFLVDWAKSQVRKSEDTTEVDDDGQTQDDEEDEVEGDGTVAKSAELAALQATQETLVKSLKAQYEAQVTKAVAEVEAKYQSTVEELTERVQKAEEAAGHEARLRKQQVYLEKAQALDNLPVPSTDLAAQLQKIEEELGTEEAEKFYATLKSADAVIRTSQPWQEIGTAQTPDEITLMDKIEKAARENGQTIEQAMLNMSDTDQRKLLAEMRDRGKGGRR